MGANGRDLPQRGQRARSKFGRTQGALDTAVKKVPKRTGQR